MSRMNSYENASSNRNETLNLIDISDAMEELDEAKYIVDIAVNDRGRDSIMSSNKYFLLKVRGTDSPESCESLIQLLYLQLKAFNSEVTYKCFKELVEAESKCAKNNTSLENKFSRGNLGYTSDGDQSEDHGQYRSNSYKENSEEKAKYGISKMEKAKNCVSNSNIILNNNDFQNYIFDYDKVLEENRGAADIYIDFNHTDPEELNTCKVHNDDCPILTNNETIRIKNCMPTLKNIYNYKVWFNFLKNCTTKVNVKDILGFAMFYKMNPYETREPRNYCTRNENLFRSIIDDSLSTEILNYSDKLLYRKGKDINCINRVYSILELFQIPSNPFQVMLGYESIPFTDNFKTFVKKLQDAELRHIISGFKINEHTVVNMLLAKYQVDNHPEIWLKEDKSKMNVRTYIQRLIGLSNVMDTKNIDIFKNHHTVTNDNKKKNKYYCEFCKKNGHSTYKCFKRRKEKKSEKTEEHINDIEDEDEDDNTEEKLTKNIRNVIPSSQRKSIQRKSTQKRDLNIHTVKMNIFNVNDTKVQTSLDEYK